MKAAMSTRPVPKTWLAAIVVATAVAAGLAIAQEIQENQWATFFAPVEVPLVNVEVVVTDAGGRPVPGLTADDFEVFEDGQPMEISNFYAAPGVSTEGSEPSSAAEDSGPEPPAKGLYLAFYIDDTSLETRRRHATLDHLRGFLREPLPPGARAMLVRYDGSLEIVSDFTTSSEALLAALDGLGPSERSDLSRQADLLVREMQAAAGATIFRSAAGGASGPNPGASFDLVRARNADNFLPQIHALAQQYTLRSRRSLIALQRFVGLLSGVSGRKGVVWVGGGLESRMAEDLLRTFENLFPLTAQRELDSSVAAREYDTADDVAKTIQLANAHHVSFFTLTSFATGAAMTAPARLTTMSISDNSGFVDLLSEDEALLAMSALTGGGQHAANYGFKQQFDEYVRDIGNSYSLGYRPPSPGDGKYHKIKVTTRRDGVRLRHREGYQDASAGDRMTDRTLAAAVLGIADNPLGIAVETKTEEAREDGRYMVPVLVRIPIDKLVLLPEGAHHSAAISLYTAVRDDTGRMSEVHGRQYPVEVPNDELLRALEQDAGLIVGLVMNPGHKRVAVTVRDERSRIESTAFVEVEVGAHERDTTG